MKRMFNDCPSTSNGQGGSVIVELCLMLPLLAMLILGATDLGLIVREHQLLQNAAREGARFSAQPANHVDVSNPSATANSIRDKVINYLAQENITVAATDCTLVAGQCKPCTCGAITINQQAPIEIDLNGDGITDLTDFGSSISVTYNRSFLFSGGSLFQFNSVSLKGESVFHNLY